MLRLALCVAVIGQAVLLACAAKIPASEFRARLYREPPLKDDVISPLSPVLETVEMRVDNFNPNNDATFQMVRMKMPRHTSESLGLKIKMVGSRRDTTETMNFSCEEVPFSFMWVVNGPFHLDG